MLLIFNNLFCTDLNHFLLKRVAIRKNLALIRKKILSIIRIMKDYKSSHEELELEKRNIMELHLMIILLNRYTLLN